MIGAKRQLDPLWIFIFTLTAGVVLTTREFLNSKGFNNRRTLTTSSNNAKSIEEINEPSHIKMCKAIVNPSLEKVLVQEHSAICHNLDKPHASLLQIFASELISEVARLNSIEVWYRHHCNPPPLPTIEDWLKHIFPIQEFLPSPLLTTDHADAISLKSMTNMCRECINTYKSFGTSSPSCVLFDTPGNRDKKKEPFGIQMITPSIQKNLRYAANLWALQKNYPLVEELKNKAFVFINCKNDICQKEDTPDSISIDYLGYFLEIPKHLHEIEIIAPKSCGSICEEKGKQILHLMTNLYPNSLVLFKFEESSAALYSKMLTTGYLICSHTETCLFPAISQEEDKYTSFSINSEHLTILSKLRGTSNEKILPNNIRFIDEKELLRLGMNGNCRHVRGRFGKWKPADKSFSQLLQYKGRPLDSPYGSAHVAFKATEEQQFRGPTSYFWESSFFPGCHVKDLIIRPSFCHVFRKMEIERVFLIGDGTVHSQAMSLWKVLGNGDDPYKDNDINQYPNFSREMECPGGNVEILFIRNDLLLENSNPVSFREGVRNCGTIGFCYPWIEKYLSFPGKTLMVASIGFHVAGDDYNKLFDQFIRTIDSFRRTSDILYLRTHYPQHANCQIPSAHNNPKPFQNYEQYLLSKSSDSKYNNVESLNEHIHSTVFHRNLSASKGDVSNKVRMEVLDIYPMTVLRNDGHLGGEECVGKTCSQDAGTRDCYNYFLPGPVDWWNHLLYNNLMDLGLEEKAYSSYVVEALKHPPN